MADLSKPGNVVDSLLFWLNAVKEQSEVALNNLRQSNRDAFQQMAERDQAKWAEHEDSNKVSRNLVPIVILGSKFDHFAKE